MFNLFEPLEQLEYIVEPFVHKDDEGYKPGIRYGWKGQPLTTEVLILTFDEERIAMPYAREFARERRQMVARSFDYQLAEMRKNIGK